MHTQKLPVVRLGDGSSVGELQTIPYRQAFRMRWICLSDEAFNTRTTELKEHLTHRSYDALRPPEKKNSKQKNSTSGII